MMRSGGIILLATLALASLTSCGYGNHATPGQTPEIPCETIRAEAAKLPRPDGPVSMADTDKVLTVTNYILDHPSCFSRELVAQAKTTLQMYQTNH